MRGRSSGTCSPGGSRHSMVKSLPLMFLLGACYVCLGAVQPRRFFHVTDNGNRASSPLWLYTASAHAHGSASRLDPGSLAPLTASVQQAIFAHQHRLAAACASASFVSGYFFSGLGSVLHVSGSLLAYGLESGKIFLWHPRSGGEHTTPAMCGSSTSLECYFVAPSNCTRWASAANTEVMVGGIEPAWNTALVPSVFDRQLQRLERGLSSTQRKSWWRAQAAAYLVRLNAPTLAAIFELRRKTSATLPAFLAGIEKFELNQSRAIFPLPAGTISAHVRHGDKFKEMALVPWSSYAKAAVLLQDTNPLRFAKAVFVSTEDPSVLMESATLPSPPWTTFATAMPRENSNGRAQMRLANNLVHFHLLQLYMALECDAWVGTRKSNWNRLIDELRCTFVPKCDLPYVEVGEANAEDYDY